MTDANANLAAVPPSIGDDEPLRLDVAARLAFRDGSMSASGLRRERDRGNLVVERIAGKEYTTLGAIRKMRERCRVEARDPACISSQHVEIQADEYSSKPSGSFETAISNAVLAQARAKLEKLKAPCATTSIKKPRRESATVTLLPSRSQM